MGDMPEPPANPAGLTRRQLLLGGALVATGTVGAGAYAVAPGRFRRMLGMGRDASVPTAPEGTVRLERVMSQARGREVDLFTAVPDGYGDGAGLPIVAVLHGGTATASEFRGFGLGRFLTQAVRDGAEPFVLAGADGGVLRWEPDPSGDDPQTMVLEELPMWLSDRGYDADRRALWGWSMGGYGVLRLAESHPAWPRAVAAFSPAMGPADSTFADADQLADVPLGLWCGTDDPLNANARAFLQVLPAEPEVASFSAGGHTRVYWNDQTLDAFAFLSRHLAA